VAIHESIYISKWDVKEKAAEQSRQSKIKNFALKIIEDALLKFMSSNKLYSFLKEKTVQRESPIGSISQEVIW
jgi:hypothetical protein